MMADTVELLVSNVMEYIAIGAILISILAFTTSVVTQFTKSIGFLNKIPTQAQVLVTAELLSFAALFIGKDVLGYEVKSYMYAAAAILGFYVATISENGWDYMRRLWSRHKPPKPQDLVDDIIGDDEVV